MNDKPPSRRAFEWFIVAAFVFNVFLWGLAIAAAVSAYRYFFP